MEIRASCWESWTTIQFWWSHLPAQTKHGSVSSCIGLISDWERGENGISGLFYGPHYFSTSHRLPTLSSNISYNGHLCYVLYPSTMPHTTMYHVIPHPTWSLSPFPCKYSTNHLPILHTFHLQYPCLMPPCTWPYFILPPFLSLHHGYAHLPSHSNIFSTPLLLTHSFVMTSMPIHQLSYIHSHQTSLKSTPHHFMPTTWSSPITIPTGMGLIHTHCQQSTPPPYLFTFLSKPIYTHYHLLSPPCYYAPCLHLAHPSNSSNLYSKITNPRAWDSCKPFSHLIHLHSSHSTCPWPLITFSLSSPPSHARSLSLTFIPISSISLMPIADSTHHSPPKPTKSISLITLRAPYIHRQLTIPFSYP